MADPINVTNAAETNLIKAAQMKKVREIDFVNRFAHTSLAKLIEVLGVTRKIPMEEGTTMYYYAMTGDLANDGTVGEGETIPLTEIQQTKTPIGEITLKKWRKATSAEAIVEKGYNQAVVMTTDAMLKDVQKGIRSSFFTFLGTGRYAPATYEYNNQSLKETKYIQLAVYELLEKWYGFTEDDEVYIILTPEAKGMHWESDNESDSESNLKTSFSRINPKAAIHTIEITPSFDNLLIMYYPLLPPN